MPPIHKEDRWYVQRGVAPPQHISHDLTADDIKDRVEDLHPRNWRAEGNRLLCDTDMGQLVQHLPTDHIFTGIDDKGLPTFRKV